MRSSSSPPNSTGSTADSDGLPSPDQPPSKNRKSFGGFKMPASIEPEFHKRPKSTGLLLEGCKKTDKLKKKKKKPLARSTSADFDVFPSFPSGTGAEVSSFSGLVKEEPEDYSISLASSYADVKHSVYPGTSSQDAGSCKREPNAERPCWDSPGIAGAESRDESTDRQTESDEDAVVMKVDGLAGTRTVIRQGKQVVFRDEDGSADDEDIMVDSGTFRVTSGCRNVSMVTQRKCTSVAVPLVVV